MRLHLICAAAISALSISTVAMAETSAEAPAAAAPVQVKSGAWVTSADGVPLGRIDYVQKAKDGSPQSVGVIYDMRIVHIPANTLSQGPKGLVTSMKKADVRKLD